MGLLTLDQKAVLAHERGSDGAGIGWNQTRMRYIFFENGFYTMHIESKTPVSLRKAPPRIGVLIDVIAHS